MLTSRLRQIELLCAYAEPLASGRRVLVVGVNAAALGEALVELGARSVHAYEAGRGVEPASAPGVVVKRLPDFGERDFDVRDGAFDLAIVPNAAELADAESVLTRLRRLVGSAGVLVVGAPAAGPLGYYELYDLVSLQFAEVAMVGQVPFAGAALAVLGDDREPEVTVDTQLAGDASPPEYFLAIASQSALDLRPYVILQLPSAEDEEEQEEEAEEEAPEEAPAPPPVAFATSPVPPQDDEERERDRAALAEARLRAEVLEAQLQDHRARLAAAQESSHRLEQELARRDDQARILVQSAQNSEEAARALQARLDDVERALGTRDEHLTRALERAVELERFAARAQELEASAVRAEQAQMSAQALEVELIELAEAHAAELAALEDALRERGRAVQELERELVRRERMIKELLLALEHAPHGEAPASAMAPTVAAPGSQESSTEQAQEIERLRQESSRLRANLESLANDAARREGELQAMRWRIDELELQRAAEPPPPTYTPPGPRSPDADEIGRLQDELDALRQALRQEHDARLRAESGDELAKARAEIQRQAVLLEQLGRERSPEGAATG